MKPPQRPSLISLWDLVAILGFAGLWIFYLQILPTLPASVPTHFNALGQPNGWTAKADLPWSFFGIPIGIWAFATALSMVLSIAQADPAKARAAAAHPLRGLLGLGLAILMGSSLLAPAYGPRVILAGLGGFFGLLVLGTVLMVRERAELLGPGHDSGDYRWGIFYVNKEDPRLFVEKRFGIGYTFNFAHPASWLLMVLILVPALLVAALLKK